MPKVDIIDGTYEKIRELKKLIKLRTGEEVSTKEIVDKAVGKP